MELREGLDWFFAASFDEVREARAGAQEAMLHVVSKVPGDYGGLDPALVEKRQALLAPVMSQDRRIAEALSNRRPAVDVNRILCQ